jgi:glycosyltransferase involved in cell wall biosynthesis
MTLQEYPYVIVLIPAFNEEQSIASVIAKIQAHYVDKPEGNGYRCDIIVVDDGSTDQTVTVAEQAGVKKVISHVKNRGLGASTRTAMQRAYEMGADIAVKIDADFQHDPGDIDKVVRPIIDDRADCVFGSRLTGGLQYNMPVTRAAGNRFFSWLVSKLTGLRVTDSQTGLMAFSRRYLRIFDIIADYNVTQQLILDSFGKHMRIIEVPVVFYRRTAGKSFISWRYPFKVIPTIFRHYLRINPLGVFLPLGIASILAGVLLAGMFLQLSAGLLTALVLVFVLGGLQTILLGFLADMVSRRR